jgi:hypothetical protein
LGWRVAAVGTAPLWGCNALVLIYWSILADIRPFPGWLFFWTGLLGIALLAFLVIASTTHTAAVLVG